jgi:hypothetical protein
MIQTAIKLITKGLDEVDNAELVLKIKGVIALFIQTMDASIPVSSDLPFILTLCRAGVIQ